jgi:hypothetical protein
MSSLVERETMFRNLASNPTARRIAERLLALEDEAEASLVKKRAEAQAGQMVYPWMGAEWHEIPANTQTLNMLVVEDLRRRTS